MPFETLHIVPGVNIEKTLAANEAGISASNFIRWRDGIPEKRGGWTKYVNTQFSGTTRCLHAWEDLNKSLRLAIGTTTNLYMLSSGSAKDITAQSTTVSITTSLTTTSGSNIVTVTDTGRNATIYNTAVFNTPVSVGGITLFGAFPITQSGGANTYQIQATVNATSSVTNGGTVASFATTSGLAQVVVTLNNHTYTVGQLAAFPISTTVGGVTIFGQYLVTAVTTNTFTINATQSATATTSGSMNGGNLSITYYVTIGPSISGTGYGIGGYGSGGYGTGTPAPVNTSPNITATDYWLDNWGEILVSCPTGGPIFTWSPDSGNANSNIISNAPLANSGMFVAMPQQQIMTWGSTFNGVSDPMQIRWSNASDFNVWTATTTNQAGGYRIPTGSAIIRGIQGPTQTLWFTDIDLYAAQYIGTPFIWGFNKLATGCGLIAPKAVVGLGSSMYWMSQRQFFMFGPGGVQQIPCSVWDAVFQNLNSNYISNIRAGSNSQFNEITWFYPSLASTGENDSYVCYNIALQEWDIGSIVRTAWIDQSVLGPPIGSDSSGYVYQHETSNDADVLALSSSFSTGYFSIGNGNDFVFVDWMIPDMKWGKYNASPTATVQISFNVVDYPGDTPTIYGPFSMTHATEFIEPRFRGRYVQVVLSSNDVGSFWRLGSIRYRYAADGRR